MEERPAQRGLAVVDVFSAAGHISFLIAVTFVAVGDQEAM